MMKKNLLIIAFVLAGILSSTSGVAQVTAYPPSQLVICEVIFDGQAVFDLTLTESEIIGGQDPTNLVVTYYESQSEADNDLNPIVVPESYINVSNPQTIYARLEDFSNGDFDTTSFIIFVIENPIINAPTPLEACDYDNDGFGEFILTDKDNEVNGGNPYVMVSYHETLVDAESGTNSLSSPYINVSNPQTVYVRVETNNFGCFTITTLDLVVFESPVINSVDDIILFDENEDGIEVFDLTIRVSQILNGQAADVTFYETQQDAINNVNVIANPTSYINIANPQTIYTRLENPETCYAVADFDLVLVDLLIEDEPDDLFIDEGDGDGIAIFDLTLNESQMLGDQDPLVVLFSYHLTLEDSENGINSIVTPTAYQNSANPQTIYVRLTNSNTGSYLLTDFEIETDEILGMEDNFSNSFKLYPNPATGIINIQSSNLTETAEVTIYNIQGQELISEYKTPKNGTISVDVSGLSTGVYFIKITSEDVSVIKRIVKE